MRTVFVHLWAVTEAELAGALDARWGAGGSGGTWCYSIGGEPYLYIGVYRDGRDEDEEWGTRFEVRGGPPAVSLCVDISGRHEGWGRVREFVVWAMEKFGGVATDDEWLRFWTREEIEEDRVVEGRRFGAWRQ